MNFGTIAQAKYILIEQQNDWKECFWQGIACLPCYEQSNKYLLWKCEDEDFQIVDRQLGDFLEESSFMCRACCLSRRAFTGGLSIGGVQVATVETPYKCRTCSFVTCCVLKPEIRVMLNNNYIGKVVQPFYGPCWGPRNKVCCPMMVLHIHNAADELIYTIIGKCCQKATCCLPFQCCGCKQISYEIRDASNAFVGVIKNIYAGLFTECCTRQDKFGISFEGIATPKDKILVIKAAIWLDYLQYQA